MVTRTVFSELKEKLEISSFSWTIELSQAWGDVYFFSYKLSVQLSFEVRTQVMPIAWHDQVCLCKGWAAAEVPN